MRHTDSLFVRGLRRAGGLLIALGLPAVIGAAPAALAEAPPSVPDHSADRAPSMAALFQQLPPYDSGKGISPQPSRQGGGSDGEVSLFGASLFGSDRAAHIVDNKLYIPPLIAPTTDQSQIGNRMLPDDVGSQALRDTRPLPEGPDRQNGWEPTAYLWRAPNTYSYPLYFEDVMLERHGHERLGCMQPIASGARFFATVPMLPYLMAVRDPSDCDYHLGYYQVGSYAPPLFQRPPYERRAALIQAGFIGGMIAIFP